VQQIYQVLFTEKTKPFI